MTTPLGELAALLCQHLTSDPGPIWVSVFDRSPLNARPTICVEADWWAGWRRWRARRSA